MWLAIAAWTSLLGHPCAHHQIPAYEVWDEIHQARRRAGRFDDAIAAKRTAIETPQSTASSSFGGSIP